MRLQGHRKRRRVPEVTGTAKVRKLNWLEYKTIRQYQTMGDILEDLRFYGSSRCRRLDEGVFSSTRNGHIWLTEDPEG